MIALLGTSSLLVAPTIALAWWAVPAAELRERLERALGWLEDPEHPVRRLVAAYRERMAREDEAAWRESADAELLCWLLDPAVHADLQRDAAAAVERHLLTRTRAD